MNSSRSLSCLRILVSTCLILCLWHARDSFSAGQHAFGAEPLAAKFDGEQQFQVFVKPLLKQYCVRCHDAENMKSGIRVDRLSATPEDRELFLWKDILTQISDQAMPPDKEPQPTEQERQRLVDWIQRAMNAAMARNTQRNGSVRRLTVSQYRSTLRDLLKLEEDLTDGLPPDGVSKDGFTNHAQTMVLSPLQVETYFDIAEKALDLCIVDEHSKPEIQNFRMDLGRKINPAPCPDKLVLGANSQLLENSDFEVKQLTPAKAFPYQPFVMQSKFEFIEGYVGNDTIREWRKFDSIYHAVFACMRGTPGYPKGEAFQTVPAGLLLRPAIPSSEVFGVSNTYGPMANFKISLRELPDRGNFRVTVSAARYDDALLLNPGISAAADDRKIAATIDNLHHSDASTVEITEDGIYQIDVSRIPGDVKSVLSLQLDERHFSGALPEYKKSLPGDAAAEMTHGFMLVRLSEGPHQVLVRYGDSSTLRRLLLSRIDESSDLGRRFMAFERRAPSLGVHVGLRRDCGSTLTRVGEPQAIPTAILHNFVFSGPINDFPSPDVEKNNVNYLAGIREIGVRSEYTDGRDMPRLLIRSIEFEGPFFSEWPPTTHRNIFIESEHRHDPDAYAAEILRAFATRAFRRPVTEDEQSTLLHVWQQSFAEKKDFRVSIKDALLVVLTSPQFLFLIENSASPAAEDLTDFELASKLSYFLWNGPPDQRLLDLAACDRLKQSIGDEVDRLISDSRFGQAMQEFVSQWLALDKFDVVAIDEKKFPKLTRSARYELRKEPVEFLQYLIRNNLPLRNLVQSEFLVANDVVASYYDLPDRTESGFTFAPIQHGSKHLGGVLCQAGILSGLSDGRESNPVKRGAWFARKIVAQPPDDPPPNVPKLPEDETHQLTLRQKLERHRNQQGCVKCHSGIDPWGLPFEQYDAAGLFKQDATVDSRSKLPDGTEVQDLLELRSHLSDQRLDQVAFSFLKHVACYATGRSLTYNELVFLQKESVRKRSDEYRTRDLIKFVVNSDLFQKK